ncbi:MULTISPECIES: sulfite exporter TauE/SafE family protein [Methylomonas]|uniref:Heavy metal transport/detoxification protein n=2 Tax=Methylomonas TaxID=416 RepID=A0A140E4U0_9GAMM|nr:MULTISPECIES: sulfite exporter TauE/SafE family protein [Methylomonas]AMK75414.1 heavy metal transport/detoxification protein [Methylomonas denitrificans]OAI01202.1 heavy metal transport/detoxification protein [Methylomonas methanica]TCV78108.1 sulfite exporter TauE/SafE [Methylomonas methanica]
MPTKMEKIEIEGMHCLGCEDILKQAVAGIAGVERVDASYSAQTVEVAYDNAKTQRAAIEQVIVAKGYGIKKAHASADAWRRIKHFALFLLLLLVVGGVAFWGKSQMPAVMQQIQPQMSVVVLLGIGFLTGFHCIGMCGGFVVAYTDPTKSKARQLLAHLSYAFGKTLSYTVLGAGFGLLGATIAITPQIRGAVALAASVFLLIYGLKMLNVFAFLRRFTLRMPRSVNRAVADELRKPQRSALRTGLLTGLLLGCGPLQAMYVMAAGSGDPFQGGMILMMFGLGTLLPLLGFGVFASLLSHTAMRQMVHVSGILVIAMGVMMAQRGMMMLNGGHMPATPPQTMQQPR